jgi:hypothetical protein
MVSEDTERLSMVGGQERTNGRGRRSGNRAGWRTGYFVSVRTELLRSLHLGDTQLKALNALLMAFASMAGPVFDQEAKTLSLCSLVRVYEDITK